MFVLTLQITDPDDAGYFTNKTLNKLHGYIRHQQVKLAVFFTMKYIKIYASEKEELNALLENEAVSFDIKRHIFNAELTPVTATEIRVYKRMHDTLYKVNKKVNQQLHYYKNGKKEGKKDEQKDRKKKTKTFTLNKQQLKTIKPELVSYYEKKQQQQEKRRYFIVKNKEKPFTIWVEVRLLKVAEFHHTEFTSYGLIKRNETPCWSKSTQ